MRWIAVLFASLLVLVSVPGRAAFHIGVIDEVMSGAGGNSNVQYVEMRMLISGQNNICHSRLTVFKCSGDGGGSAVLIDDLGGASALNPCLADMTAGHRWIMASPSAATFLAASGITPDFTWSNSGGKNIPTSCGMVCWGAPSGFLTPPEPPTWDATLPSNYVDCVAYGPYDGAAEPFGNAAATATPGGGTFSLTRSGDIMFSNNFRLACPTPTASGAAQTPGSFGSCTPPTTTSSTTTTPTTTTTTTTTPPPSPSKCSSKEFAAAGKKAGAKAKCHSQAVAKGDSSKLATCLMAAETKFAAAYGKATKAGDCNTTATAPMVEPTVDNFITSLKNALVGTSTSASKCTSKELGAAGKLAGDEAKCYTKAIGKGDQSTVPGCVSTAKMKFETSYAKAMNAGGCINTTTAATVEGLVDNLAANLKGQLAP